MARRAAPAALARPRAQLTRRVAGPLALLTVVGLAAAAVVAPPGAPLREMTDPQYAAVDTGVVSRNNDRPALSPSPSPTASASPSAAASPSPTTSASPAAVAAPSPSATPSVTPSPAPTPTPTPTPEPVDYTAVADSAGTRYATAAVNVRTGPGTGYDARMTIAAGADVAITGWAVEGWRQVVLSDRAGWIKESYLTTEKPAAPAPPTASRTESASGGGGSGFSSEPCADAAGIESGLTTRTRAVLRAVCAEFPKVDSYGGYRSDGGSYHSTGQAIDVMVSGEYGWEIARWARANASALGIIEVIYSQQIWTAQRSGDGWRGMEDRGGVTANHYDHVHISVR